MKWRKDPRSQQSQARLRALEITVSTLQGQRSAHSLFMQGIIFVVRELVSASILGTAPLWVTEPSMWAFLRLTSKSHPCKSHRESCQRVSCELLCSAVLQEQHCLLLKNKCSLHPLVISKLGPITSLAVLCFSWLTGREESCHSQNCQYEKKETLGKGVYKNKKCWNYNNYRVSKIYYFDTMWYIF